MSLTKIFDVAGSAMTAQAKRLNVVASNLANADSTASSTGEVYKARQVVFKPTAMGAGAQGVAVEKVVEDQSPMRIVHNPAHPTADSNGNITMPNVNVVDEMVNMISASRAYQNNVEMMNTVKAMLNKTLQIGQ
jgi:flagellar basal-body rod protein FlgC